MPKVVIVGAGISGLALAYRLTKVIPAADVTVLEQQDRPGGAMWTERIPASFPNSGLATRWLVEIGPNGFLDTKPSTLALCHDLGLGDRLVPANESASRNRYLFLGGKLRLLPGSLASFLGSDLLSWRGKLGVLTERFRSARRGGGDESIDAFVRRRAGREAAEILADAFVTGIHAGDPALLSVRAAFPRLVALEEQYGSILRGMAHTARRARAEVATSHPRSQTGVWERGRGPGKMWSCRDGLRTVVETLSARLPRPPLFGIQVRRLERAKSQRAPGFNAEAPTEWKIFSNGQDCWLADAVVLTCPAYQQAAILADSDQELAERVGGIAYNRIAVVALGYRQADVPVSLDGFGFIAPQRTRRDLLGVQWCSSIFADRAPPGLVLLRAMCGGWHRLEIVSWDDTRLLSAVRAELRLAMSITAEPIFHFIVRWERAIPQYQLGHLERVAWIDNRLAQHPGLFLGGNAYRGVAVNDCTEQAEILAQRLPAYLGS